MAAGNPAAPRLREGRASWLSSSAERSARALQQNDQQAQQRDWHDGGQCDAPTHEAAEALRASHGASLIGAAAVGVLPVTAVCRAIMSVFHFPTLFETSSSHRWEPAARRFLLPASGPPHKARTASTDGAKPKAKRARQKAEMTWCFWPSRPPRRCPWRCHSSVCVPQNTSTFRSLPAFRPSDAFSCPPCFLICLYLAPWRRFCQWSGGTVLRPVEDLTGPRPPKLLYRIVPEPLS